MATRLKCVHTRRGIVSLHVCYMVCKLYQEFKKQYAWIKKTDTSADLVCKISTKEQPAGTSLPLKTLEQWPYQQIRCKGNRGSVNEAPRGHKWSQVADPVHKCSNRFVLNCARVGWAFSFSAFFSPSLSPVSEQCLFILEVHSGEHDL